MRRQEEDNIITIIRRKDGGCLFTDRAVVFKVGLMFLQCDLALTMGKRKRGDCNCLRGGLISPARVPRVSRNGEGTRGRQTMASSPHSSQMLHKAGFPGVRAWREILASQVMY